MIGLPAADEPLLFDYELEIETPDHYVKLIYVWPYLETKARIKGEMVIDARIAFKPISLEDVGNFLKGLYDAGNS